MLKSFFILFLCVQIPLLLFGFEIIPLALRNPTKVALIFAMIAYNLPKQKGKSEKLFLALAFFILELSSLNKAINFL